MGRNLADLRFTVHSTDGYGSLVWRLWVTKKGDVYLATRGLAGVEKFSFHVSGICRRAFTTESGAPPMMDDRVTSRWVRAPIAEAGQGQATRVAYIGIPTDYLSYFPGFDNTGHLCISPAAPGGATYFELWFTSELEQTVQGAFAADSMRNLLLYTPLPDGYAVFLSWHHADWQNEDIKIPGEGKVNDLIFSSNDPLKTGRRIRITIANSPTDGNAVVIKELGGYALPSS